MITTANGRHNPQALENVVGTEVVGGGEGLQLGADLGLRPNLLQLLRKRHLFVGDRALTLQQFAYLLAEQSVTGFHRRLRIVIILGSGVRLPVFLLCWRFGMRRVC